jgi:hypothetical protein
VIEVVGNDPVFAMKALAAGLGFRMASLNNVGVIGADHLVQALRRMNV